MSAVISDQGPRSREEVSRTLHLSFSTPDAYASVLADEEMTVKGVTSPPHSVVVSGHSATWVAVSWQPPEVSHPSEKLRYRLHHKAADDPSFVVEETDVTSHVLEHLTPNTKYIMFVSAVSQAGESLPSETLLAWTEPALPPHVEVSARVPMPVPANLPR